MNLSRLDKAFSEYIRLKYSHKGKCKCFTCGKEYDYKMMDCGHFIDRRFLTLRFEERNCHPQCITCNRFKDGNIKVYTQKLIDKYGEDIIEELNLIKNSNKKFTQYEIDELTKYYKQQIKILKL